MTSNMRRFRVWDYERTPQHRAACAERWPRWQAAHPEEAAAMHRKRGLSSTSQLWRCDEPGCGRIIPMPAIGMHQKSKAHYGRTRVDTTEDQ